MFNKAGQIKPEFLSKEFVFRLPERTRSQKVLHMINECIRTEIEIPKEWIDEYNESIKVKTNSKGLCEHICKRLKEQERRAGTRI